MSEFQLSTARVATPLTEQRALETQALGAVIRMPIALAEDARRASINKLNQLLVDVLTLRDGVQRIDGPSSHIGNASCLRTVLVPRGSSKPEWQLS